MKKIIIAFFLAVMLLMVPVSTVGKTVNNPSGKYFLNADDESPVIYITEEELFVLDQFIDQNFEGEDKTQAEAILEEIISYDQEYRLYLIDVNELADALDVYGFKQPIPKHLLTFQNIQTKDELLDLIDEYWGTSDSPFKGLIEKIIDIIKPRLGWMYDLVSYGGELFANGINLAIDFIELIQNLEIAITFATLFNLIVSIPLYYFSEAIRTLFDLDIEGFFNIIEEFTGAFTIELSELVDLIEVVLELLGPAFDDIKDYVAQISDFVDWLTDPIKPWQGEITVSGFAKTFLGEPYTGAEVTCRGVTVVTDSQGRFEFTVQPSNDAEDSKPENSWYGVHNCVITVSKDGVVKKQTPVKLSYVFSGGEITWPFFILKVRSRDTNLRTIFAERLNLFLQRFQFLVPNILKAY